MGKSLGLSDIQVAIQVVFDSPIALTGEVFKASQIKNNDLSTVIFDQPLLLQAFSWSARLEMCQWIRENWTRRAYGTRQEVSA
jgi:hypothetical protein